MFVIASGVFCIGTFTLFPLLILQSYSTHSTKPVSVVDHAIRGQRNVDVNKDGVVVPPKKEEPKPTADDPAATAATPKDEEDAPTTRTTKDGRILPIIQVKDLETDEQIDRNTIGRGVAAAPSLSQYLDDAERAHIECDINVDSLAYWNIGETQPKVNPFHSEGYITFAPDRGGWNNVRLLS